MDMKCIVGSLIVLLAPSACAAEDPAGHWEGTAEIPGITLRLVVDLSNDHGTWRGSATLPEFSVAQAPLAEIATKGADVAFSIPEKLGGLQFKGRLTSTGDLSGDLQQAGNSARLVLHRTGASQWEVPKPPTPLPKDYEGEWTGQVQLQTRVAEIRMTLANKDGAPSLQFHLGPQEFPAMVAAMEGPYLTVRWKQAAIAIEGKLNKGTGEIEAIWERVSFQSPFVLRRAQKEKP